MNFIPVFKAMVEIVLMSALGYGAVKLKIFNSQALKAFSDFIIYVALPSFILSNFIENFQWSMLANALFFPCLGVLLMLLGIGIAYVIAWFLRVKGIERNQISAVGGIGNYGYLPMAVVLAVLSSDKAELAINYIFLYILTANLLSWSLGPYLIAGRKGAQVLTVPFLATVVGIIFGGSPWADQIPEFIVNPLTSMGKITIPFAMFIMGGILGTFSWRRRNVSLKVITSVLFSKLLLLPMVVISFLFWIDLPWLYRMLVILEAASPPAVNLSLMAKSYESGEALISSSLIIGYLLSIVTIPFFLAWSM